MKDNGLTQSKTLVKPRKSARRTLISKALPEAPATDPYAPAQNATPPRTTSVRARIDVGFGNQLFIRGQGDGLSWEKGIPMECVDPATWVWSTERCRCTVVFKLLLNDVIWAEGSDLGLEAGESIDVSPRFQSKP